MRRRPQCRDCDQKRDAYRPVFRRCDGTVEYVCRQCWRALDYDVFMHPLTEEDRAALRAVSR